MKKVFILFVFLIFLSCDDNVPIEIQNLGKSLISNPENIYRLSELFPESYDENLIYKEIMANDKAINRIYKQLKQFFNYNTTNIRIKKINTDSVYIEQFNNYGYNLSDFHVDEFAFCKDNGCLSIMMLSKNNKYYIFKIETTVDDPYKEGF